MGKYRESRQTNIYISLYGKKSKPSTFFQLTAYLGTQTLCMKKVTPVTKKAEGIQPILEWLLILAKHFLSHILSHVINQSPLEITQWQ